jgi:hypothetical protein
MILGSLYETTQPAGAPSFPSGSFAPENRGPLSSTLMTNGRSGINADPLAGQLAQRVLSIVETGDIARARRLLAALAAAGIASPAIDALATALRPPDARPSLSATGVREPEVARPALTAYRGSWVALRGSAVVKHAATLSELEPGLDVTSVVVHWVPA